MFNIYLNEKNAPLPNDDICYIIGKNGIFMKKKMGMVETLAKVDSISILDDITPYARFDIPKIPLNVFAQVVSFVRSVYADLKSESMVLIFFNSITNDYIMHAPKQKVTGGGIDYKRGYVLKGYNNIGTIHSHAGMSAFHSGVDVNDEKDTDGIHFTIGKCGEKNYFDITASLAFNGSRFPINAIDYVEGLHFNEIIEEIVEPTYLSYKDYGYNYGIYQNGIKSYYSNNNECENNKPKIKQYKKILGYSLDIPLNEIDHPLKWNEMVSKPEIIKHNFNPYSFGSSINGNEHWKKQLELNQIHINKTYMNQDVSELFNMPDFNFHQNEIDDLMFNPCHTCIFVNHKITMEVEGELDDDVPDFDGDDVNHITKEQLDLLRKGGD